VVTLREFKELEEAEIEEEEENEKGVHLMEYEEEYVDEADEGELLVLRRNLSGLKVDRTMTSKGRISFTLGAP